MRLLRIHLRDWRGVAEREIECARHGATFDLTSGAPCSLPATKPVARYEARVVDGIVEVELG